VGGRDNDKREEVTMLDQPRIITDKELLDFLDEMSNGDMWISRRSTTGRGYRLHNCAYHTPEDGARLSVREAIIAAMKDEGKL